MPVKIPRMKTPGEWGARAPRREPELVPRSRRVIFHHTAGHHPELGDGDPVETTAEAFEYARRIQAFHMDVRGWDDSGHNFLVCRNGLVLVGRWFTVAAIQHGLMVRSAHCPGQNGQIGIEHEHRSAEPMTAVQREASARLQAWIADRYRLRLVLPADPHSKYFATECPANLKADIEQIRTRAQVILTDERTAR